MKRLLIFPLGLLLIIPQAAIIGMELDMTVEDRPVNQVEIESKKRKRKLMPICYNSRERLLCFMGSLIIV